MTRVETLAHRIAREGAVALRSAGVRDLDVLVARSAYEARFEFTDPTGARVYAAVYEELESYESHRDGRGPVVLGSSYLGYPNGYLRGLVEEVREGSAAVRPGPLTTNASLRALESARDSLGATALGLLRERAYDGMGGAFDPVVLALAGSTYLDAEPGNVTRATRLLLDAAAGVPVEWALRRTRETAGGTE